jgi:hypothetical protein
MKTSDEIRSRLRDSIGPEFPISARERDLLEAELDEILRSIASHSVVAEAEEDLSALGTLQELLATLLFKYKVDLTKRQRAIVRQFDRSDDPDERNYVFTQIKNGHL